MALLWLDSFDDRTTSANYLAKYDAAAGSLATQASGRTGQAVTFTGAASGSLTKSVAARAVLTVGFGIRVASPPNGGATFLQFLDGNLVQCYLQITSGSTIELRRGGDNAILGTTLNTLSSTVWAHVELKVTFSAAAGACRLNLQGTPDLTLTGLNTRNAGSTNDSATSVRLFNNNSGCAIDLDDLYIGDTLGANNTDLLGPIKIECLRPAASGAWNQWTPVINGARNYTQVNEADPDGDATYNSAAGDGLVDTYGVPLLSSAVSGATIAGLQLGLWARKDDIAVRKVNHVVRSGGNTYDGATLFPLSNSYAYCPLVYEQDPATAALWTSGGIGLAEFGMRSTLIHTYASGAVHFAGLTTTYNRISDAAFNDAGPFTTAFWINLDAAAGAGVPLAHYDDTNYGWYVFINGNATPQVRMESYSPGLAGAPGAYQNLSRQAWHLIVAGSDQAGNTSVSLDGAAFVVSSGAGVAYTGTHALNLGSLNNSGNHLLGAADSVGYWSRLLSQTEVGYLWNAGLGLAYYDVANTPAYHSLQTSLVAWYDCDDTAGDNLIDATGNGRTLLGQNSTSTYTSVGGRR